MPAIYNIVLNIRDILVVNKLFERKTKKKDMLKGKFRWFLCGVSWTRGHH